MSISARFAALQAADRLDENDALGLVNHIRDRFGWSVTIFTVEDCWVRRGDDSYTVGESEGEVTEEMKDALRDDRGFNRWLDESLSEAGNRQLPTLVIEDDGSFRIES